MLTFLVQNEKTKAGYAQEEYAASASLDRPTQARDQQKMCNEAVVCEPLHFSS